MASDIGDRDVLWFVLWCRFKAVLTADGITATSRVAKLLHTGSALFKQESRQIEW